MKKTKEITYNTIGDFASLFFQWLIILLIPKVHSFNDAGIFTIAISITSILYIISSMSMWNHQVSDHYQHFTPKDYAGLRIITTIFGYVLLIPISILFEYSLNQILAIIAYLSYRNVMNFANIYAASLQIESKLDYVGKCTFCEGVVSFSSFLLAYYITDNLVVSIAVMAIFGGGTYFYCLLYGFRKYVPGEVRRKPLIKSHIKILMIIGCQVMFASLVPTIINALPKLFLQNMYGNTLTGIYGTISAPIIVIPTLITALFAPFVVYFSNLAKTGNFRKFQRSFTKCIGAVLLFGLLVYLVALLLQRPIFQIIYGHEIDEYIQYFALLIIAIVFYSIGTISSTALITKNQWNYSVIAGAISFIFSVIISYFLTVHSGFNGATYALVYSYLIYAICYTLAACLIPLTKNNYQKFDFIE